MSARQAAKNLGDVRAETVEARRVNTVGQSPLSGMGATPSMGLSQFRGGAKHNEAKKLGAMLRKHVEELHGGAYADAFCGGMVGGASNSDTGAYDGEGRESADASMSGIHYPEASHRQFYEGGGELGRVVGGRRKRAPAGANDGRRKRAEIVKKVMAEKGMKMIEASKYVKAHGLYDGGGGARG
jgi:hypothetical protein